jgi:hypothetical protein
MILDQSSGSDEQLTAHGYQVLFQVLGAAAVLAGGIALALYAYRRNVRGQGHA